MKHHYVLSFLHERHHNELTFVLEWQHYEFQFEQKETMRSEHLLHHDDITLYVKDYMLLNIYYIDMHTKVKNQITVYFTFDISNM